MADVPRDYAALVDGLTGAILDDTPALTLPSPPTLFRESATWADSIRAFGEILPMDRTRRTVWKAFAVLRVVSVPEMRRSERELTDIRAMEDLLVSAFGQRLPFGFLIACDGTRVGLYFLPLAVRSSEARARTAVTHLLTSLESGLRASYPGLEMERDKVDRLSEILQGMTHFAVMSGVPSPRVGDNGDNLVQIEKLARGLAGEKWLYLVVAEPVGENEIAQALLELAKEISSSSGDVIETRSAESGGEARQLQYTNRDAQHFIELLERQMSRMKVARSEGLWRTSLYVAAAGDGTLDKLRARVKGLFSGEESTPEPVRVTLVDQTRAEAARFRIKSLSLSQDDEAYAFDLDRVYRPVPAKVCTVNLWTSPELAVAVNLPQEEFAGYGVRPTVRFGVAPRTPSAEESGSRLLMMGSVLDRGSPTETTLVLPVDRFTKHALVSGVTGSGKSRTCMEILGRLWVNYGIPFLVVEPTKGEYRALEPLLRAAKAKGPSVRVYTLGRESVAPFRLNPLEVPPGVSGQRHFDDLKGIFNATFPMYGAMPYIMEEVLLSVYERHGWDFAADRRGSTPTLAEVYLEIERLVPRLGYFTETTAELRAALRTRIRNLMVGSKGKMLNCAASVPIKELLDGPTILELAGVGDDDEKAFLMGVLFANLFEYRESEGIQSEQLRHVTLIEEAHRLLASAGARETGEYRGNPRAKAIETLCNVLTEIRAYGEGVIIADQVPTKLAPDALKNTNIKVIHRIVSGDDRDEIARTMGLREDQSEGLIHLRQREAVVFAEGMHRPVLVEIDRLDRTVPSDAEVAKRRTPLPPRPADVAVGPFPGCVHCDSPCDYLLRAERVASRPDLVQLLGKDSAALAPFPSYRERIKAVVRTLATGLSQEGWDGAPVRLWVGLGHCAALQAMDKVPGARTRQTLGQGAQLSQELMALLPYAYPALRAKDGDRR